MIPYLLAIAGGYLIAQATKDKQIFAKGGKVKERVYIDYLNKKKKFQKDRKYFDSYEEAREWALKNIERFNPDMIKYEKFENYDDGGEIKINEIEEFLNNKYEVNVDDDAPSSIDYVCSLDGEKFWLELFLDVTNVDFSPYEPRTQEYPGNQESVDGVSYDIKYGYLCFYEKEKDKRPLTKEELELIYSYAVENIEKELIDLEYEKIKEARDNYDYEP
jgi:hypothetical protein